MRIQKLYNNDMVLMFLLATPFNRKLISQMRFINFNVLKKNIYFFNAAFLLYLCGSLHLISSSIIYMDRIIGLDLPCLFCVYSGFIYTIHGFNKISGFVLFLDLLCISFLLLLNLRV